MSPAFTQFTRTVDKHQRANHVQNLHRNHAPVAADASPPACPQCVSKRRNPLIADLFRRIEMVEAWGRGMPLILEHEPDVKFQEMADIFIAAFGRPSFAQENEASTGKDVPKGGFLKAGSGKTKGTAREGGQTGTSMPLAEGLVEGLVEGLAESQKGILTLARANGRISKREMAKELGISTTAVDKNIEKLKAKSLLKRVGPAKGGHWEVLQ